MRILLMAALLLGATQAAAQPYAYVPNESSNNLSVIDTATNTVVDTIGIGSGGWGVAITPDYSQVYVSHIASNDVRVIDTATNTVVATIPVGASPYGVAISPDGSHAYVTNFNSNSVSIIDTATQTVVNTVAGTDTSPYSIIFSPDGTRAYVGTYSGGSVNVIDTATETILTTIPGLGGGLLQLTITPDGNKIYAGSEGLTQLRIIDAVNNTLAGNIFTAGYPVGSAITGDGQTLYVAQRSTGAVLVIDVATDTITDTIATGGDPWGIAFTPDNSRIYVADSFANQVFAIDATSNTLITSIPVGSFPFATGFFITPAFGNFVAPIAQGVQLDAAPPAPVVYAEEIIASPGSPVTLLNPAGDLNLSANLGYNFSIGEVRYARFECGNGLVFDAGSAATYDGAGSAGLGAINGLGGSAMHFSITANDNNVTEDDRLVITGNRQITGTDDINCTYSLYDFPSQAASGGTTGRVYSVSGPYIRFAASYALEVDDQGNPVADVESGIPAFAEFVVKPPTNDSLLGHIGGFSYGTRLDMGLGGQPLTPAGTTITLAELLHADTALVFEGDFDAATDVYFSPAADCAVNIQSADDFSQFEAVFTIGDNDALNHHLCFLAGNTPVPAGEYTVALDAVPAAPAVYAVTDLGPLDLGRITRNGTELQAPLVQVPGGWLSRVVLTNSGPVGRAFRIEVFGETGNVISTTGPMSGVIQAESTRVIELNDMLTGFTGQPRATLKLTVAAPNNQVQGLYQIVNPDSGSISNHVMVRPGSN